MVHLSISKDKIYQYIAWHLPRKLVMWCYMRIVGHATTGRWSQTVVPELDVIEAIKRWDESNSPYANVIPWSRMTAHPIKHPSKTNDGGSDGEN